MMKIWIPKIEGGGGWGAIILEHSTVVSRLSTQLEPRSFVRTLPVGAYFRRSIPKSPAFHCNVKETDRQAPE